MLSKEGAAALSLRRLATDVGTSTTAVYSLFGGKPALVRALFAEAFHRFGGELRAVPRTGDPLEDLVQAGLAYRRAALADPHLYPMMFGAGLSPDERTGQEEITSLLAGLVGAASPGAAGHTETVGIAYWGLMHGLISLELSGITPFGRSPGETYEQTLRTTITAWLS